jgi:hypothetical protein
MLWKAQQRRSEKMTYDSDWLKRRVSTAANEYDNWTPSLKEAMKLTPNTKETEATKEQEEPLQKQ